MPTLRFAEEILLLLLDDRSGRFAHVIESSLRCAIAGAVLMDLALENRIDTDPKQLVLVDAAPVGDDLLDPTLADIARAPETRDARYWVNRIAGDADRIRETALRRLVERGILQREDDRFLWVFRARRYPVIDGEAEREVKLRIMEVLFSDVIPAPARRGDHRPRGLLRPVRRAAVAARATARGGAHRTGRSRSGPIPGQRSTLRRKLDLIGQAVIQTVAEIDLAISGAMRTII